MVDVVKQEQLDIDLEVIFQAAFGPSGGSAIPSTADGLRTDELMPGTVVYAPDKSDPSGIGSVTRTVEIAYSEELVDATSPTGFTRGRWVLLFSDGELPRGFQTGVSRRWAVPVEAQNVVAGIEWLDRQEYFPQWWWRVDPDNLHMDSSCGCLLARLDDPEQGIFEEIASAFFGEGEEARDELIQLGFYVRESTPEQEAASYRALDHLWRSVILDRRAQYPKAES